jgi:ribosome biogenesis protein SSF1/2
MRHYTITVRPHGVSRRVRKLLSSAAGSSTGSSRRAPNLASSEDIADYLLRRTGTPGSEVSTAGYDSTSETEASEAESDTNAVELPEDYGKGNKKGERKAVRLVETGPRMELRLIKVVEGLVGSKKGEGETVFHELGESKWRIFLPTWLLTGLRVMLMTRSHEEQIRGERPAKVAHRETQGEGCQTGRAGGERRQEEG